MTETRARGTVLAVASGKGGVGKTNVTVNLAVALSRLGHRVTVVDADFGLGNVDVLLGLAPSGHIGHVLSGEKTLQEIAVPGPRGIRIVPAGSGLRALAALGAEQREAIAAAIVSLASTNDFVLIDTASGIADAVLDMLLLAERVVLVTSLEPSAIVDAYATAKILTAADPRREIGIVVNTVRDGQDANAAFQQLDAAAVTFLGRTLEYYGFITDDPGLREAVLRQRAVVDFLPDTPASRGFRILASRLAGLSPVDGAARRAGGPVFRSPVSEVAQCA